MIPAPSAAGRLFADDGKRVSFYWRVNKVLLLTNNVAPTHVMPVIRPAGNGRELMMAGWGLIRSG